MAVRLLHTTVHYDGLYSYNRDFQLKLSNDPSIRWDSLDQELWTLWCTSQARPFCSKCHKHGHNSAVCTMKNRSSFVPMVTPSASISTTPPVSTPPSASMPMCTCASNVKGNTLPPQVPAAGEPLEVHHPNTPINMDHLRSELCTHLDQAWCSHLINALQHGASIGYHSPRSSQTSKNLTSASLHPEVIDNKLHIESAKGQLQDPTSQPPSPTFSVVA